MSKIGHIVIATNKYIEFVQPLLASSMRYFLPKHETTMFLFTNTKGIPGAVTIEQEHYPWPGMTLRRYEIFWNNRDILKNMDYLYYTDVDMLFVGSVGDEILGDLTATIHPGYYNTSPHLLPYEKNPRSTAYVRSSERHRYFAGGFNGGKRDNYLDMAKTIYSNIQKDFEHGYVAIWHDESHLNRYFIDHPPGVVLDPSYCFPKDAVWARENPYKTTMKLCPLEKNHKEYQI
jgi:histo-blood group ABO system transferase